MAPETLNWHDSVAALRDLEGRLVAVRIALRSDAEELVAVFHAVLGTLDEHAKQPSLFWTLGDPDGHAERPGIYLREKDFTAGERRAGGLLVIEQRNVVVNVRPLARRLGEVPVPRR